ncbi:sensor histidine kinase [Paenibacillus apis]|uniref:histidine kinase n=1 Tax=Paenibacillus apis TaxID=1792174 RepID=A0A920CMK8_9BACL|nr:HAMP domain-containing sensor histidine kinase [Paenibacillus apis]GIO42804.1 two-component sensor histidine kinase [Paenibacillus apis]
MNRLQWFVLLVSFLALFSAIVLAWHTFYRQKKLMKKLNDMLDSAAAGSFSETMFDESMLSAVETRMANYLSASLLSERSLAGERDKIKMLIADISHQTKTPIANILLYAELLSEQQLPEESMDSLEVLKGQAGKLAFLVDALVKISRLESGVLVLSPRKQPVQLLLEQVLEQAIPKAAAKQISVHFDRTESAACYDLKWTAEALYNLLDNAIKYTAPEGEIHLAVKTYELFLRIDVSDNGIGISEEEQPRIFARFYRSPAVSETEGVGIGLYLSRQIITGQGGYIRVQSTPHAGSIFSVYLPLEK